MQLQTVEIDGYPVQKLRFDIFRMRSERFCVLASSELGAKMRMACQIESKLWYGNVRSSRTLIYLQRKTGTPLAVDY